MNSRLIYQWLVWGLSSTWYAVVQAQGPFDFERTPIDYHNQPASNLVSELQEKILAGEVQLEFHRTRGYLDSFLQQLNVSKSSQVLVYSKSSVQLRWISPLRPRALYFNEEVYVGWVLGGDVLEMIVSDSKLGTVFYTLLQQETAYPRFQRDSGQCLQCHANRRTQQVPGPVVRSLFTESNGQPIYRLGNFNSDHTSPFSQRWGGYYVTGNHGPTLHMGNLMADRDTSVKEFDYESGANLTDLSAQFNTGPYPTGHSDIVALMVLEHQAQMQNLITKARYEEIQGEHYDAMLHRDQLFGNELTQRKVVRAGEALLAYMLFVNEYQLRAPVRGTSGFSEEFSSQGPHDQQGRSLYQLDLETRLFKYPLSYMIYTDVFRQLPPRVNSYVSRRLYEVLTAESTGDEFAHLDLDTRKAILQIVEETCPDLIDH